MLFVNVPIAVGAVLAAPRLVPESRDERQRNGFDVAGAFTVTAGLAVLIYALVDANSARWGSGPTTGLLVGASLFSMFFFISLYMQQVLGWDALKSGLAYLPLAVTIIISAGVASVLVTKIGFKPVVIAGLLFIAAGLILFSRISAGGSFLGDVLFPSLLAALGLGFSFVPVTIGGTTAISQDEAGLASGLINAGQQVGGALGLAILAALATARTDAVATGVGNPSVTALTEGFSAAFLGGAAFALIGAVLAVFLIRSEDSRALIGQNPEPAA